MAAKSNIVLQQIQVLGLFPFFVKKQHHICLRAMIQDVLALWKKQVRYAWVDLVITCTRNITNLCSIVFRYILMPPIPDKVATSILQIGSVNKTLFRNIGTK